MADACGRPLQPSLVHPPVEADGSRAFSVEDFLRKTFRKPPFEQVKQKVQARYQLQLFSCTPAGGTAYAANGGMTLNVAASAAF